MNIGLARNNLFKHALFAAVVTGLVGGVIAFAGIEATGVRGYQSSQQKDPAPAEFPRTTVAELKEKMAKHEKVLIIDSRGDTSYDKSEKKIAGAIRVPPNRVHIDEIESRIKDLSAREVVIYCSCSAEETSGRIALMLLAKGYKAYALKGGWYAWLEGEGPIEPKAATKD